MLRARLLQAAATSAKGKPTAATMTPRQRFVKNYLSDSATYPIIGIMGAALSLVAFSCSRIAFGHPDVTFSKAERDSLMRENDDSAEKHHEHWVREHVRQRNGETQIMPALNNMIVNSKIKN